MLSCWKCGATVVLYDLPPGEHHSADQAALCGSCRRLSSTENLPTPRALLEGWHLSNQLKQVDSDQRQYRALYQQKEDEQLAAARQRRRTVLVGLASVPDATLRERKANIRQEIEATISQTMRRSPSRGLRAWSRITVPICGDCCAFVDGAFVHMHDDRQFLVRIVASEDLPVLPCTFCDEEDVIRLSVRYLARPTAQLTRTPTVVREPFCERCASYIRERRVVRLKSDGRVLRFIGDAFVQPPPPTKCWACDRPAAVTLDVTVSLEDRSLGI